MRGARLSLPSPGEPGPEYRGRQKVVVRSRLAAVCEIQIACELQPDDARERRGRAEIGLVLGVLVLACCIREV